jgi:hypothetical protein
VGSVETHAAIKRLNIDSDWAAVHANSLPPPYFEEENYGLVTLSEQALVDCAWPFGVQVGSVHCNFVGTCSVFFFFFFFSFFFVL